MAALPPNTPEEFVAEDETDAIPMVGGTVETEVAEEASTEIPKETTEISETQKETPKPSVKPQKPQGRDYSIFDEADRPVFRGASNEAFERIKAIYQERKEASQKIQESTQKIQDYENKLKEYEESLKNGQVKEFYTHPDAWRLSPEAQQLEAKHQRLSAEIQFVQEQLQNIESGENYYVIAGYNQDGTPNYKGPFKGDVRAKIQHQQYLNAGMIEVQSIDQQYRNLQNIHAQRLNGSMQYIQKVIDDRFSWSKDPKHELQKYVQEFQPLVPPEFKEHPSTKLSAFMYATMKAAILENDSLKKKIAEFEKQKITTQKTEPGSKPSSGSTTPATIKIKGVDVPVPSEFVYED